jgi:hypothetical protein
MVRRCFPVAKIVGSSPTGVVLFAFCQFFFAPLLRLLTEVFVSRLKAIVQLTGKCSSTRALQQQHQLNKAPYVHSFLSERARAFFAVLAGDN